jgi:uncharacterized protein YaeQ
VALKATVYKADLQISDMDRHYYAAHALTLAQHPSETDERLMVRLLAFALHADERLVFGKGLSSGEEPDLWQKDLTGAIDLWIELGQPDEQRIRQASGRARKVVVYTYSGRSAGIWWERAGAALQRVKNLSVVDIAPSTTEAMTALLARSMRLQYMVQDGEAQLMDDTQTVQVELSTRM